MQLTITVKTYKHPEIYIAVERDRLMLYVFGGLLTELNYITNCGDIRHHLTWIFEKKLQVVLPSKTHKAVKLRMCIEVSTAYNAKYVDSG